MLNFFDLFYKFKNQISNWNYTSYPVPYPFDNSSNCSILVKLKDENNENISLCFFIQNRQIYVENLLNSNLVDPSAVVTINQSIQDCYENGVKLENIEVESYKTTEGEINSLLHGLDSIFYHLLGGGYVVNQLPSVA
jgi:hypothetical protein